MTCIRRTLDSISRVRRIFAVKHSDWLLKVDRADVEQ